MRSTRLRCAVVVGLRARAACSAIHSARLAAANSSLTRVSFVARPRQRVHRRSRERARAGSRARRRRSDEEHRLVEVVRDEHHGLARALPELEHRFLHRRLGLHVERGERLVHQQHVGRVGVGAREVDALAHAARQLLGIRLAERRQPDRRRTSGRPGCSPLGLRHAARLGPVLDVAARP